MPDMPFWIGFLAFTCLILSVSLVIAFGKISDLKNFEEVWFGELREVREGLDQERRRVDGILEAVTDDAGLLQSQGVLQSDLPSNFLIDADGERWFLFEYMHENDDAPIDISLRLKSIAAVRRRRPFGDVKVWIKGDGNPFVLVDSAADQFWRAFWKMMGCPEPGTSVDDLEDGPSRRILLEEAGDDIT